MISSIISTSSDPRVAFAIGGLEVRWYGLIIVCAMVLALIYACSQCKKIGLSADDGVELFLWIIPIAVVFARIFYVFPGRIHDYFPWHAWSDFVKTIAIWDGGITIIGGIVGGIIGGIIFTVRHRKQTNFANVADLVTVPLLGAQIIGRIGNFINQEAFGLPITNPKLQTFPFAVYITEPSGIADGYESIVYGNVPGWFCATFFYEMVWNFIGLIITAVFWFKGKNKKYPGLMIIFYFFWYFLGRWWLEYLRIDAVPVTKVACAIVVPLSLIFGAAYVVAKTSRDSYKRVREIIVRGELEGSALTAFDIKNYAFVGKTLASAKNPLKLLYGKKEYISVDFDAANYYAVPKKFRSRLRDIIKGEEYSAQ